jgi:hypothetical protein
MWIATLLASSGSPSLNISMPEIASCEIEKGGLGLQASIELPGVVGPLPNLLAMVATMLVVGPQSDAQ